MYTFGMKEQFILEAKPQEKFDRSRLTPRAQNSYAVQKDIFMTDHEDIQEVPQAQTENQRLQNPQEKQKASFEAYEKLNATMRSYFEKNGDSKLKDWSIQELE